MSAAREWDIVSLSIVGVPPIKVHVDYQHGAWCYVWTGRTSLGPVADAHHVLRLIAWTLSTGGAR
ncbi:hypothetical protein [Actinomadura logoneensis]|uniref:hypothetical protein n=1 Tax=Actinomadura logoneensis TaxID=2293572 RepID=UPI0011C191CC|nr:hypothetical protein [Actinomadura logoneensis]